MSDEEKPKDWVWSHEKALAEILRLRAENEKLRSELEAIKSPPDYGTQKIMNEQIHYASVIAQKDRENERLRAENEKLRKEKAHANYCCDDLRITFHDEVEKLRAALKLMINTQEEWEAGVEKVIGKQPNVFNRAIDQAKAAIRETGDE